MKNLIPVLSVLAGLVWPGGAVAQDFGGDPNKPKVQIQSVSVEPSSAKAGAEVSLVIEARVDFGWHVYGSLEEIGTKPSVILPENSPVSLSGEAELPPGLRHEEFGLVSHWVLGKFTVRQPVQISKDATPGELSVSAKLNYQPCDETACLPDQQVSFDATVTVEEGVVEEIEPPADDDDENRKVRVTAVRFEPDRAAPGSEVNLVVEAETDVLWHVYGAQEETGVRPSIEAAEGSLFQSVGDPELADGIPHEAYGITSYWVEGKFTVKQRMKVPEQISPGPVEFLGSLGYMACDETMCLPPAELDVKATLTVASDAAGLAPTSAEDSGKQGMDLIAFLLASVAAGLFALVMPCTYPMIPITISFFTKQADARHGSVLPLSLAYGFGIVAIYVLIGLTIGEAIIPFATHPITNVIIGGAFVVFAFALFGMITLEPPRFLMNVAGKASTRGGLIGVFLMGATLVVTSFTCSAPFVGTLLALGAGSGDLARVALGMGVFGLTMAIPFVVLSLVPGRMAKMPKAGQWMNTFKVFLGFVEMAAALKFLSNAELAWGWYILPIPLFLGLWAAMFGSAGLYLFGLFGKAGGAIGGTRRLAGVATLALAAYCIWGAAGKPIDNTIMTPIAPPYFEFGGPEESGGVITDQYDLALSRAKENKVPLLINFTGVT